MLGGIANETIAIVDKGSTENSIDLHLFRYFFGSGIDGGGEKYCLKGLMFEL